MRILKLLAVATLTAVLLVLPAAPRAAAEPALPDLPRLTAYPCTPYGKYCFHGKTWREKSTAALRWSDRHPSRAARKPVPYPGIGSWQLLRYYHVVYVVQYGSKKNPKVYKYGITRQVPWKSRPRAGMVRCKAELAKKFTNCRYTWVATVNAAHGYYWARYLEASLIKDYENRYGKCPPGQRSSCR